MKISPAAHRPLVAVVGDASKCRNPKEARQACEALGTELAQRGCRIIVFSSSRDYIEWELVKGYLAVPNTPPGSIEVRYPPDLDGRFEGEKPGDPRFIRTQQTGDWEASMYPAFALFDGVVLIGGSQTARIMGLLALGSKTPLIALGGFGGGAEQVWNYLKSDRHAVASDAELNLMAERQWHGGSAQRLIDALLAQRERRVEAAREATRELSQVRRAKSLTRLATIGCLLFFAVLLAMVELLAGTLSRGALWVLFGAPALAGASAAAIRVIYDHWSDPQQQLEPRPIVMTVALGFWAAGAVGLLFLLPQIWVLGTLDAAHVGKLSGFAVPIGIIAGLTLDKVFPRLIKTEVPIEGPNPRQSAVAGARRVKGT